MPLPWLPCFLRARAVHAGQIDVHFGSNSQFEVEFWQALLECFLRGFSQQFCERASQWPEEDKISGSALCVELLNADHRSTDQAATPSPSGYDQPHHWCVICLAVLLGMAAVHLVTLQQHQ